MIKKSIYPKTVRFGNNLVTITEKLDGSNLVIFKFDENLYVAQRNNIFRADELTKDKSYKDLDKWLDIHAQTLLDSMHEGSAICGEWLGMGKIKYDVGSFDKRFYMFAKANIDKEFNLYNIIYNHDHFRYPFIDLEIPHFIGVVPIIAKTTVIPNVDYLNSMYTKYTKKVDRDVEGFVIDYNNSITKYVRLKNGKLKEHTP